MFSGGSYEEVERWLRNFLVAHAKRVSPRLEVELDASEERGGFGARLALGGRTTSTLELDYQEVARNRGGLAWCAALAARVTALASELTADRGTADARTR